MPSLKYKDPADGQWKVSPVPNPSMTHAALSGLANDDHADLYTPAESDAIYYQKVGGGSNATVPSNYMTGVLNIESANPSIYIHNPNQTHVTVLPGNASGFSLKVVDPSDNSVLRPVHVGTNLMKGDTLISWDGMYQQMSDRVSGPHGPRGEWTRGGAGTWVSNAYGGLTYPVINCPGMWKIQITADLYVTNPASAGSMPESFFCINARWAGGGNVFNNNLQNGLCRLSLLGGGITELITATACCYAQNVPGDTLVATGQVLEQGAGEAYAGGDYKHTFEFFPYATNDSAWQTGWVGM